jgi:two-component sensor histidine kinase
MSVGRLTTEFFRKTVLGPGAPMRGSFTSLSSLDGQPIRGFYERIPSIGWTVSGALDKDAFDAPLRRAVWLLVITGAVLLAVSLVMAFVVGRVIRHAIYNLVGQAEALGRGDAIRTVESRITEINQVSGTLINAQQNIEDKNRQARTLMDELNHRAKNTMAALQALARYSYRPGETGDGFHERFEGRLLTLSKTHDLLMQMKWDGASLQKIARNELDAYGERVAIKGEDVFLSPRMALSLSMVLHELATNAAKYGPLSREEGTVALSWGIVGEELHLEWRELGGSGVIAPEESGVGMRLIESSAKKELGGTVQFDFRPEGLVCKLAVPLPA